MEEMGEDDFDGISDNEKDLRVKNILKQLKKYEGNETKGAAESEENASESDEEAIVEEDAGS